MTATLSLVASRSGLELVDAMSDDDMLEALGPVSEVRSSGQATNIATLRHCYLLDGDAPPLPGQLIDGHLLDGDITMYFGKGDSGKSLTALYLALHVALGRSLHGTFTVRRPGTVLLVCPEGGTAQARMALDAMAAGLELDEPDLALLRQRIVAVEDDQPVSLQYDTARLAALAVALGAVLIVLDPMGDLLGGADQNDNALAGMVMANLRRDVCRGAQCAVLIVHHDRKPGKDADRDAEPDQDSARGASAWMNGTRLAVAVRKRDDRIKLTATKSNRLRKADMRYEWDVAFQTADDDNTRWTALRITDANAGGRSISLTPGVGRELNANERSALACLDDQHEPGRRLSWSRWGKESGLNEHTFRGVRDRLLDAALAQTIPTGKKGPTGSPVYVYAITDDGRKALASGWVSGLSTASTASQL